MAQRDKTHKGLKIFAAIVSILLAAAIILAACAFGLNWIQITPAEEIISQDRDETDEDGDGVIIETVEEYGISLLSARMYSEVIEDSDNPTYTLTATITPAGATVQAVDWTIAWSDATSEWANGKTVTDYVTITPTSDGALTATLECLQAFGEQIIVTVTSRQNAGAVATATVDYAKRFSSVNLTLSGDDTSTVEFTPAGSAYTYTATGSYENIYYDVVSNSPVPVYGTGTVEESSLYAVSVKYSDDWITALQNNGFSGDIAYTGELTLTSSDNTVILGTFMGAGALSSTAQYDIVADYFVYASGGTLLSNFYNALSSMSGKPILTITVVYWNSHEIFGAACDFYIDASNWILNVSSVSLDQSSITF